jgi:hypothetical protein
LAGKWQFSFFFFSHTHTLAHTGPPNPVAQTRPAPRRAQVPRCLGASASPCLGLAFPMPCVALRTPTWSERAERSEVPRRRGYRDRGSWPSGISGRTVRPARTMIRRYGRLSQAARLVAFCIL